MSFTIHTIPQDSRRIYNTSAATLLAFLSDDVGSSQISVGDYVLLSDKIGYVLTQTPIDEPGSYGSLTDADTALLWAQIGVYKGVYATATQYFRSDLFTYQEADKPNPSLFCVENNFLSTNFADDNDPEGPKVLFRRVADFGNLIDRNPQLTTEEKNTFRIAIGAPSSQIVWLRQGTIPTEPGADAQASNVFAFDNKFFYIYDPTTNLWGRVSLAFDWS